MMPGKAAKVLVIDSNVLFAKRLADALRREGFEVTTTTQPAFALIAIGQRVVERVVEHHAHDDRERL